MNAQQHINQWGRIVNKAWEDDMFKKRLLAEPVAVFKEFDVEVPTGIDLRVVENTDHVVHLTLPAKPRERELSDAELEGVTGGAGWVDAFKMGVIMSVIGASLESVLGTTSEQGTKGSGGPKPR